MGSVLIVLLVGFLVFWSHHRLLRHRDIQQPGEAQKPLRKRIRTN